MRTIKLCVALLVLVLVSACTTGRDLEQPPVPLGDFMLGHSIVVAPNLAKGPLSRDATQEEWIAAVDKAFEDRFRRYDGDRLYHFGISVEGYVLARVGVPLVLQPKSALIYRITVWDDAAQTKMNSEPKEVTVLEAVTAESVAGSGLTQTREEQLEGLAVLAAKQAEEWLVEQVRDNQWFEGFVPEGAAIGSSATADAAETALAAEVDAETTETAETSDVAKTEEPVAEEAETETTASADGTAVAEPAEAVTDPLVLPIDDEAEEATN
ncbi:MAG: hypothetical protein MK098_14590 [Marinovum sp.]|nr:hypothetical protein [Marinovum sp.]